MVITHQDENGAWVGNVVLYETLRYTVHRFQESVQWKPRTGRPKVRTEENIETVQR
jgi:hypothetical protein